MADLAGSIVVSAGVNSHFGTIRASCGPPRALPLDEDLRLREALKRCPPSAYYAAYQFHLTGDAARIPPVVFGIVARYVEPSRRARLESPDDSLRLDEDLGLDSLTLVEIAALVEEVLPVSLADEELSRLRTLGGIRGLIETKLRGWTPPA